MHFHGPCIERGVKQTALMGGGAEKPPFSGKRKRTCCLWVAQVESRGQKAQMLVTSSVSASPRAGHGCQQETNFL